MKETKLTDIDITHISLVEAGANRKTFIYKSADQTGDYDHTIVVKKTDEERGIIYGIVYAPNEVDSQGEFATEVEIQKAAYRFMKSRNVTNVDREHSFELEDAFVAESWLVKAGDPIFPDEPAGSWAVAIQLESDELKKAAKKGDLQGLSMAGKAKRTIVEKDQQVDSKFKNLFATLADAVSGIWIDISTHIEKNKGEDMSKDFAKEVKQKIEAATSKAGDQLEKAHEAQNAKIKTVEKSLAALKDENTTLTQENEALAKASQDQKEEIAKLNETNTNLAKKIEDLEKGSKEVQETLKKSTQSKTPRAKTTAKSTKGVM